MITKIAFLRGSFFTGCFSLWLIVWHVSLRRKTILLGWLLDAMCVIYFPFMLLVVWWRSGMLKFILWPIVRRKREIHQSVGKYEVFQKTGSNPVQNGFEHRSWLSSGLWLLVKQLSASESTAKAQERSHELNGFWGWITFLRPGVGSRAPVWKSTSTI